MNQTDIYEYNERPEVTEKKRKISDREQKIRNVMIMYPFLCHRKKANDLLRKVWQHHGEIPAESVLRWARWYRAEIEKEKGQDYFDLQTAYKLTFA